MSRSRLTDDDIADFVAMLLVKVYTKNSGVDQPLEAFMESARKHGNAPLAACLGGGIETFNAVSKLLLKKRRQYKKALSAHTFKAALAPLGIAETRVLYQNKAGSKAARACRASIHYEAIAESLLAEGLKDAKNKLFAPNTYYSMQKCVRKSNYHTVMRKHIRKALLFNPYAQSARRGRS